VSGASGCSTPGVGATGTVACVLGNIPDDNSTHSVQIVAAIPSGFTGSVANTATVSSPTPDPLSANNTASFVVSTAPSADLSIQKPVNTTPLDVDGPAASSVL